jgi:hypothetical protein
MVNRPGRRPALARRAQRPSTSADLSCYRRRAIRMVRDLEAFMEARRIARGSRQPLVGRARRARSRRAPAYGASAMRHLPLAREKTTPRPGGAGNAASASASANRPDRRARAPPPKSSPGSKLAEKRAPPSLRASSRGRAGPCGRPPARTRASRASALTRRRRTFARARLRSARAQSPRSCASSAGSAYQEGERVGADRPARARRASFTRRPASASRWPAAPPRRTP